MWFWLSICTVGWCCCRQQQIKAINDTHFLIRLIFSLFGAHGNYIKRDNSLKSGIKPINFIIYSIELIHHFYCYFVLPIVWHRTYIMQYVDFNCTYTHFLVYRFAAVLYGAISNADLISIPTLDISFLLKFYWQPISQLKRITISNALHSFTFEKKTMEEFHSNGFGVRFQRNLYFNIVHRQTIIKTRILQVLKNTPVQINNRSKYFKWLDELLTHYRPNAEFLDTHISYRR